MSGSRYDPPELSFLAWVLFAVFAGVCNLSIIATLHAGEKVQDSETQKKLVPARFSVETDDLGFRWDLNNYGMVSDGSNDCFDNGLELRVNNTLFQAQKAQMTKDEQEYFLTQQVGDLKVLRRLRLLKKRGAVRYIEIIQNPTGSQKTAQIQIRTRLGDEATSVYTSGGKAFSGELSKQDIGLVAVPQPPHPSVMFLIVGRHSRNRPQIMTHDKRRFYFSYDLTIPPRSTRSILHVVAQRKQIKDSESARAFTAFYRGGPFKLGIPKHHAGTIVNFRSGSAFLGNAGTASALRPMLNLLSDIGIQRSEKDKIRLQGGGTLNGTINCQNLHIETRFGKLTPPLHEIGLLVGEGTVGRTPILYLRSGEILPGRIEAKGLRFTGESGVEMDLDPTRLDMLIFHKAKTDGKRPAGSKAYLSTHPGERLIIGGGAEFRLRFATPWGTLKVPTSQICALEYQSKPQPLTILTLTDGTYLPAIISGSDTKIPTLRFGEITLKASNISRFSPVKSGTGSDIDVPSKAHCLLLGNYRMVGKIGLDRLHLESSLGTTAVNPDKVFLLDQVRSRPENIRSPAFAVRLKGGTRISGVVRESVLPIRIGDRTLRVPVRHILSYRQPSLKPKDFFEW
ncbi:MAG: hypothetical protein ACLFWL_02450 [Candidatus Brocadiia bacterium]